MGGTYRPSEVNAILTDKQTKSSHVLTGFVEDSKVEVNEDDPDVELQDDVDGNHAWVVKKSNTGVLVAHLKNTSASNDWLSDIVNRQKRVGGGLLSVLVKDLSGRSVHYAPEARIERNPDKSYEESISELTWNILLAGLDNFTGGNA